jgi:nitric oxide reductase NorQ protein
MVLLPCGFFVVFNFRSSEMSFFSREARSQKYKLLRELMINSNGLASFEACHKTCQDASIEITKADWSAIKHQYKIAIESGEKPVSKAPVKPVVLVKPVVEPEEENFLEETESMSEYDDGLDDGFEVPKDAELESAPVAVKPAPAPVVPKVAPVVAPVPVPAIDPYFSFNPKLKEYLNGIEKLSRRDFAAGKPSAKIRLVGPAGCGKTMLAMQFAAKAKRPCVIIDCPTLREAKDLFGFKTADDKGIRWIYSQFVNAIRVPRMVVILDEINRLSPMAMNTFLPMADSRGQTFLDDTGEFITVAAGVTFFCTMNEGSQFTGTDQMDGAISDRFSDIIEVDYLDEKDESLLLQRKHGLDAARSDKLAMIARTVRAKHKACEVYTKSLSTRLLENAASKLAVIGNSSLEFSIVNHFADDGSKESERAKIRELLKGAGLA